MYLSKEIRLRTMLRKSEEMWVGLDEMCYHSLFMDHLADAIRDWQKLELKFDRTEQENFDMQDALRRVKYLSTIIWAAEEDAGGRW